MKSLLFSVLIALGIRASDDDGRQKLKDVKKGQEGYVKWLGRLKRKTVYSGLGKEEPWYGKLKKAVDFTRPRYVYADLTESEKPLTGHGSVIGYRIAENLVIHSMVGTNYLRDEIDEFIRNFGGKLLKGDEIRLVRKNFSTISKMRKKIGDTELPTGLFWAKPCSEIIEATTILKPYEDDLRARIANIILKR